MLVFKVCGVRQNLYVFSLYRNPDLDDGFFIVYYHQWLPCRLGIFVLLSCSDQFVVGPTHARGGTLDLLMTDVPDQVQVAVVAAIGN